MRLIDLKEVMHKTSLARATVYKFIKEGRFPISVSLGGKKVGWLESEVDEWIMDRVNARKLVI